MVANLGTILTTSAGSRSGAVRLVVPKLPSNCLDQPRHALEQSLTKLIIHRGPVPLSDSTDRGYGPCWGPARFGNWQKFFNAIVYTP